MAVMSRYMIHKSGGISPGLGSRPLSETARVRKYGRIRGFDETGLLDRIKSIFSRDTMR
jgi:hypothetical protein